MGAWSGNYTRGNDPRAMFDEQKRYLVALDQAGTAAVDADFNDMNFSLAYQLRRIIENGIGDGSPNNGFLIAQATSTSNNFKITGGDGTPDGAGRYFQDGMPAALEDDVDYTGAYTAAMLHVMPKITSLSALVLTDSAANWAVNEHAGKTLTPDVTAPGTTFTIASNTATTITVTAGDMTTGADSESHYRIELSTPSGGARVDEVDLDLFFDEVNATEDPNLIHTALTPSQAAAFRLCLRQYVRVKEGGTTPASYVDTDGHTHYTVKIATLNRPDATANILTAHITDERDAVLLPWSLRVRETDGSPNVSPVTEIRVSNGKLTDVGGGVVSLDLSGTGSGYDSRTITQLEDIPAVTPATKVTTGTRSRAYRFPDGSTAGQFFEFNVPMTYIGGDLTVWMLCRAAVAVASPNNVIRVTTDGEIFDISDQDVDTIASSSYDVTVGDNTTGPTKVTVKTLTAGTFGAGDRIQLGFQRIGGDANDLLGQALDVQVFGYDFSA